MSDGTCKCGEDINYAINNGKCDGCIEGYIENLEDDNAALKQAMTDNCPTSMVQCGCGLCYRLPSEKVCKVCKIAELETKLKLSVSKDEYDQLHIDFVDRGIDLDKCNEIETDLNSTMSYLERGVATWKAKAEELEAEMKLYKALSEHARHDEGCNAAIKDYDCKCGFTEDKEAVDNFEKGKK